MSKRLPCPPAPGPLEEYAVRFDDLFDTLAQRRGFREYLQGLLLPKDRNKTLTALANTEPISGAQGAPAQRLQFFLSESGWESEAVNARRLELLREDSATRPHEDGVLIIDETGDRKDGKKTAHVAYQYLSSVGRIANGIVSVSSVWADESVYYPLHIEPYEPAERLPRGKTDPTFRTKPNIGVELVDRAREAHIPFRAVVADSVYGESPNYFEGELWKTGVPYVLSLRPHKGRWDEEEAAHTPEEAARRLEWNGPEDPREWRAILRRFRDGHEELWWAAEVKTLVGYGPEESVRLVAVTTDPATLPANSSWYLTTNLPAPGSNRAQESKLSPADLKEVVRLYGLRMWVEQSYKHIKGALGFSDFQVRSDHAIRRHWQLVFCAFSFCWWAYIRRHNVALIDPVPDAQPPTESPEEIVGGKRRAERAGAFSSVMAGSSAAGAELVGPMDHALALLAGVVGSAPAATIASAS
jgi:SRSO17 transposase